jgi:spermidine synthase
VLKWELVETAQVGRSKFALSRRGDEWMVQVDRRVLMVNRTFQSEISLAEEAIARVETPGHVLIGGLGFGYTLRAALDVLPPTARVSVAELVPELVEWNRRHLRHLTSAACDDPRCEIVVGDAFEQFVRAKAAFDAILLDVDNGPEAISHAKNRRLYNDSGVRAAWDALTPGGVLGVWSAVPDDRYATRLKRQGFATEVLRVPIRKGARATHVLFLARKRKT